MDFNRVQLLGRLTRDPKVQTFDSGNRCTSFSLATNNRWKDKVTGELKEKPDFHNIVIWGRLGETCEKYVKKGSRIFIEGRLSQRKWKDKKNFNHEKFEVVADEMIMLDNKNKFTPIHSEDDLEVIQIDEDLVEAAKDELSK